MRHRNAPPVVKAGLTVYDRDGQKVGYVDDVRPDQGWMEVGLAELEIRKLWLPYRIVERVERRGIFVALSRDELLDRYPEPPPLQTEVVHRQGKTIAVTSEPNGYTVEPTVISEVDVGEIKRQLAVGQRVSTSDAFEVGKIKNFDASTDHFVIEKGMFGRDQDMLLPVHLVGSVRPTAYEATLAVRRADLERISRPI